MYAKFSAPLITQLSLSPQTKSMIFSDFGRTKTVVYRSREWILGSSFSRYSTVRAVALSSTAGMMSAFGFVGSAAINEPQARRGRVNLFREYIMLLID